jgi:hypothetical protein
VEKSVTKGVFMVFPTGWSTFPPHAGAGMLKTNKLLINLI